MDELAAEDDTRLASSARSSFKRWRLHAVLTVAQGLGN